MPSLEHSSSLPDSSSPTLTIAPPSQSELIAMWTLTSAAWSGPLSLDSYIRRETHMANQAATRDGGIRRWILCDAAENVGEGQSRRILASCETIHRKALIAYGDHGSVKIDDVVSYGVAAVYTNPHLRRRGYAGRMMKELARVLGEGRSNPQVEKCLFSVLYSDLGKEYYAKFGWQPYPSTHMALFASTRGPEAEALAEKEPHAIVNVHPDSLQSLCALDLKLLHKSLLASTVPTRVSVAMVPDVETLAWHHAREEFTAKELFGRTPDVKGAKLDGEQGQRAWILWNREWAQVNGKNVGRLYILRLAVEGGDEAEGAQGKIGALLHAALREAAQWEINEVQIWNPSAGVIKGARAAFDQGQVEEVDRPTENICCLQWTGGEFNSLFNGTSHQDVDWIGNERYGWL